MEITVSHEHNVTVPAHHSCRNDERVALLFLNLPKLSIQNHREVGMLISQVMHCILPSVSDKLS